MVRKIKASRKEREQLKTYYDDPRWDDKVNSMTDREVIDILYRLQNQGRRAA